MIIKKLDLKKGKYYKIKEGLRFKLEEDLNNTYKTKFLLLKSKPEFTIEKDWFNRLNNAGLLEELSEAEAIAWEI